MTADERDPVALIGGTAVAPDTYRCPRCRALAPYAAALPTGGAVCNACGETITRSDVVHYPGMSSRILAAICDFALLVPATVPLFIAFWIIFRAYAPENPNPRAIRHYTHNTMIWAAVIGVSVIVIPLFGYFWQGNSLGKTYGKRFMSMTVVDATTGLRLGVRRGLIRTVAQVLTIATFGIGYLPAFVDRRRRTLHDRIAGSMVVEA